MSNESGNLREFVGFVWPVDDFSDQIGLLVRAVDVTEAGTLKSHSDAADINGPAEIRLTRPGCALDPSTRLTYRVLMSEPY